MALHSLILTYVVVMLAGVAGTAIYSEMRRRSFEPSSRVDHIFPQCEYVTQNHPAPLLLVFKHGA